MAKEFTLPVSGKKVSMRDGKGIDVRNAQRAAQERTDVTFALIAEVCEFDGEKIPYEALFDFDMKDIFELQSTLGE